MIIQIHIKDNKASLSNKRWRDNSETLRGLSIILGIIASLLLCIISYFYVMFSKVIKKTIKNES